MSVHMNVMELKQLHASIHRLAKEQVTGATLEQVEKALKNFHDGNATRLDHAFKIYWQLQEQQDFWPAQSFIERLQNIINMERKPTLKEYWLTGANHAE